MLILFEQISIYMFFILQPILDCYSYWLIQMNALIGNVDELEDIPLWGMPKEVSLTLVEEPEVVYEESQLEIEHELFFADIANSLTDIDCPEPEIPFNSEDESEFLTMNDWMEEPAPIAVTPQLSTKSNAKIIENIIGEQTWVVEVVGEEQTYIHISDGSARAWVNTADYGYFQKGDILSLLVERRNDQVIIVKAVDILQRCSSDFLILDEDSRMEEPEYAIA